MEELIKAFELLRNNCKEDNCTPEKCPFCFRDWATHCKLGSSKQMYPNEWGDANKDFEGGKYDGTESNRRI